MNYIKKVPMVAILASAKIKLCSNDPRGIKDLSFNKVFQTRNVNRSSNS